MCFQHAQFHGGAADHGSARRDGGRRPEPCSPPGGGAVLWKSYMELPEI